MDDRDQCCTQEHEPADHFDWQAELRARNQDTTDSIRGKHGYEPSAGRTTATGAEPYWPNQPRGYEDVNERAIREDAIDHS